MTENASPSAPPAECAICKVTYDEIRRLRLEPLNLGTRIKLSHCELNICSRCERDPMALTQVMVRVISEGGHTEEGRAAVAYLMEARDNLVRASIMAPMVEEMTGFKRAWQSALDHHHSAIDEVRQLLGMKTITKGKPVGKSRLMVLGAALGALVGGAVFSSPRPLEVWGYVVKQIEDLVRQVRGIGGVGVAPEDAPLH